MNLVAIAAAVVAQFPQAGTDTMDAINRSGEVVRPAGTRIQSLVRVENELVLSSTFKSARGTVTYDTVAYSLDGLLARWHRVHAPSDSAAVVYEGNRVHGYVHPAGAPMRRIDRILPDDVAPGDTRLIESTDWSQGPRTVRTYDMWTDTIATVTYRPLRRDSLTYRGRATEGWVVQEDRGAADVLRGQPFIRLLWIDATRRKILRRQDRPVSIGTDDGYVMTAR